MCNCKWCQRTSILRYWAQGLAWRLETTRKWWTRYRYQFVEQFGPWEDPS
jgi:hypothetical protein